jgi:hypothetical protein
MQNKRQRDTSNDDYKNGGFKDIIFGDSSYFALMRGLLVEGVKDKEALEPRADVVRSQTRAFFQR